MHSGGRSGAAVSGAVLAPVNFRDIDQVDSLPRRLLDWLFPARCLLCGGAGEGARMLCVPCDEALARNTICCPRCAEPLAAPAPVCGRCLRKPPAFVHACVPLLYAYPLDALLTRLKFGGDLAAARLLGEWVAAAATAAVPQAPDLIVPMPLARRRLAERGYNQALELARPLSRRTGARLAPAALRRVRDTAAQSGLDRKARRANVRAAFLADSSVRGARVWLVDDIVTTAATARSAASAIKRAGAREVVLVAVARASGIR